MPVRKFRSVEDMPGPARHLPGDPALYRTIAGVWTFGARANPRRFPPGVHRYRSIDEMNHVQDQWDTEHVARLQAQRERR